MAKELCNDYSLCSLEIQYILEWLEHCYRSETLSGEETGLDFSEIGSVEFIEKLISMIALREGIGDILAEGLLRIDDKFDQRAMDYFTGRYPGVGFGYEMPREYPLSALIFAMQPRVTPGMIKEINTLIAYWTIHRDFPDKSPMDGDLFRKAAARFWGNDEAWDLTTYAGKAQAVKRMQDRNLANDSLVMCSVAWPLMISDETSDHMGDPALESKLFSAVTGIETDETGLHEYGERIFNLQRAILLREGWRGKESDNPEEFNFTDPVENSPNNPRMIVPGPGDESQSIKGNVLERDKFEQMREEYYRIRAWDPDTGLQKTETLEHLSMADIASELKKDGLVV
jgi:aldehyde:ferredoxin oxidoreductase